MISAASDSARISPKMKSSAVQQFVPTDGSHGVDDMGEVVGRLAFHGMRDRSGPWLHAPRLAKVS